ACRCYLRGPDGVSGLAPPGNPWNILKYNPRNRSQVADNTGPRGGPVCAAKAYQGFLILTVGTLIVAESFFTSTFGTATLVLSTPVSTTGVCTVSVTVPTTGFCTSYSPSPVFLHPVAARAITAAAKITFLIQASVTCVWCSTAQMAKTAPSRRRNNCRPNLRGLCEVSARPPWGSRRSLSAGCGRRGSQRSSRSTRYSNARSTGRPRVTSGLRRRWSDRTPYTRARPPGTAPGLRDRPLRRPHLHPGETTCTLRGRQQAPR